MGLILMSLHDKILNHDVNELDHRDILHKQTDILLSALWKKLVWSEALYLLMGSQKSKKPA
ncbi:hypothetical protein C2U43_09840 [Citrobacter freundii complex sp. CFNIH9]|uniref:hypothetical protein n=1 Tax=Citrobacter portucalensis TaxID=1639133 RepID=UPI000CD134D0|nr:hypothetical protein C2U43_09840 [Citrobacter freundii complex sp. CFNIH9]